MTFSRQILIVFLTLKVYKRSYYGLDHWTEAFDPILNTFKNFIRVPEFYLGLHCKI